MRGSPRASVAPTASRSTRYRQLINPYTPVKLFSEDELEMLHATALQILETQGMRVLSARARGAFAQAGADVDESGQIVRLDRGLIEQALHSAPREVVLTARNPARSCRAGGAHVIFAPVAGPPNVTDLRSGKRPGTLQEFSNFVRLAQSFDVVHVLNHSVEAQDVPLNERHLETTLAQLTLSDKVPAVWARGEGQIRDCFELLRLAHGRSPERFRDTPVCYTVCNTNSPLQLDVPMAEGIMDFAHQGQLVIVTPFTLAGAMAPVTIPGALTLAHAEALLGIVLAQIVRPGAPVMYGSFTSNVDMKSGSPAFGTPEYVKAAFGAGQLARRLGLPWRSSNATASNAVDAQAAYESQMSLWGAIFGGCNLLLHGAGWLEGGLTASFEKFILDIEMLQMMAELFQPTPVSAEEIGLDAVAEAGPGGHFFGTQHTLQRFRDAFYMPMVSDWRNFGAWQAGGSKCATERAAGIWTAALQEFTAPSLAPETLEALHAYSARRKAEGGALPPG